MNTETKKILWSLFVLIVLVVVIILGLHKGASTTPTASSTTPVSGTIIGSTNYECNGGATITANFYSGQDIPASNGNPPVPGGSVEVKLSDGRDLTLHQTISADGIRYSDGNPSVQGGETFVFWSKGNGALVLENNVQKSYIGCIRIADDPGGLPQVFESGSDGFSIRYPLGYTVEPNYTYTEFGPSKSIHGVKFTIPASIAKGTNLGSDSYVSVEQIPAVNVCTASLFLDDPRVVATSVTDNGMMYSVASSTGAGAGNRYAETVYAIPGSNPCIAVRYFVHYSVIDNYPPGTVNQFDEASLTAQFDTIRHTLVFDQTPS